MVEPVASDTGYLAIRAVIGDGDTVISAGSLEGVPYVNFANSADKDVMGPVLLMFTSAEGLDTMISVLQSMREKYFPMGGDEK